MGKRPRDAQAAGSWVFRDIPRGLMHRVKVAAAIEQKSIKQFLMDLAEQRLAEMERKGLLPKGH